MHIDNKHQKEVAFRNGFRDAVKQHPEILDEMEVKLSPFPFKACELMEDGHTEFNDGYGYTISLDYERYGKEVKLYASCDDYNSQHDVVFQENKNEDFAAFLGKNTYECICKLMLEIEEQGGFEYEDEMAEPVKPVEDRHKEEKTSTKSERYNDLYVEDLCVGFRKVDKDKMKWKYELRDLRTFMDIPKLLQDRHIEFTSRAGDRIDVTIMIEYACDGAEYRVDVHINNRYSYESGSLSEYKYRNKNHFYHALSAEVGRCMGKAMLRA